MDALQFEQALHAMSPFVKKSGIKIKKADPGDAVLEMGVEKDNFNHVGTFHAAAIFGLGETAGGVALISRDIFRTFKIVAKGAKINYRKPIAKFATATAQLPQDVADALVASIEKDGKGTTEISILIKNENNEEAAEMSVEYHMRKV